MRCTLSCKPAHVMEARVSQKLQESSTGRPTWGLFLPHATSVSCPVGSTHYVQSLLCHHCVCSLFVESPNACSAVIRHMSSSRRGSRRDSLPESRRDYEEFRPSTLQAVRERLQP